MDVFWAIVGTLLIGGFLAFLVWFAIGMKDFPTGRF